MRKLKLNKKVYKIPTSWNDIYLDKFLELRDLSMMKDKLSEIDYNLKYTSVFTDISVDELYSLPIDNLKELMGEAFNIMNSQIPILTDLSIKLDGVNYDLDSNTKNLTYGQFVDLELLLKDGNDVWEVAHKVTATFLRKSNTNRYKKLMCKIRHKINKDMDDGSIVKYDYHNMERASEVFYEQLPMPYIYTVIDFFLTYANQLLASTVDSSQVTLQEMSQLVTEIQEIPISSTSTITDGTGTKQPEI